MYDDAVVDGQPKAAESTVDAHPDLDHAKLLGFRNLIPVTRPDSDIRESSDLAFNKKGEAVPPPTTREAAPA